MPPTGAITVSELCAAGVASILVQGGQRPEYHVLVDPARMQRAHTSIADVVAAGATEVQLDAPAESIACALGRRPVEQLAGWIAGSLDETAWRAAMPVVQWSLRK